MIITRVTRQKRKKDLYSVFIDGEYAFSVTDENRVKFGITEGTPLESDEISGILAEDEKRRALDYAFGFLETRSRSRKELIERLRQKEFSPAAIAHVVQRMEELGYVNDERFARDRFQYLREKGNGPELIRMELKRKGVASEIISGLMSEYRSDPEEELRRLKDLAQRKLKTMQKIEPRIAAQRLTGYLARKGFSIDSIRRVLRALKQDVEDEAQ